MTPEKQFIKSYGEYILNSRALIDLLFHNLDPNLSGEKAAEINKAFNDVCDSMEQVENLGKEAAKTVNFPMALAN